MSEIQIISSRWPKSLATKCVSTKKNNSHSKDTPRLLCASIIELGAGAVERHTKFTAEKSTQISKRNANAFANHKWNHAQAVIINGKLYGKSLGDLLNNEMWFQQLITDGAEPSCVRNFHVRQLIKAVEWSIRFMRNACTLIAKEKVLKWWQSNGKTQRKTTTTTTKRTKRQEKKTIWLANHRRIDYQPHLQSDKWLLERITFANGRLKRSIDRPTYPRCSIELRTLSTGLQSRQLDLFAVTWFKADEI